MPPRTWDRVFFSTMSVVILGIVYYGFAHSYFLAGTVRAPLPNILIHIHGAVFTSWIILLLIQNALVLTNNVRIHRKLGMWGFGLAASMFVLGILAGVDAMRRGTALWGLDAQGFLAVPLTDITLFAILIYALLLTVAAYDLISLRRISRTTIWASALVVLFHLTRIPLGHSAPWHAFASLFL